MTASHAAAGYASVTLVPDAKGKKRASFSYVLGAATAPHWGLVDEIPP